MLGMMNKGGQNMPQAQGGNPALAGLFRNNMPAAPGGMPATLPQIMPPQRPNIGMPPKPVQPVQTTATTPAAARWQDIVQQNRSGRAGQLTPWGDWIGTGGRNAR